MIGNVLLTVALLASLFTMVMYYYTYKGYTNTLAMARLGYHIMAVMVVAASLLLLHAILTHQYEYKYVFSYSGSGMSTGLLMSTFYAGQEGSFMVWLLLTAIVGLILLEYSSKRDDLEPRVMMVYTFAAFFLLIMVNPLLKSPFTYIWSEDTFINLKYINQAFLNSPIMQGFVFEDPNSQDAFVKMGPQFFGVLKGAGIPLEQFLIQGKGLNPLLQNFWMQIHPPMLFVGFSMATVPFAFAFAALIKNEYKNWVKQSFPWVLAGTGILGLAIMMGGYWAYGVLGWGGYWGWDPVENSSLVPWIIGVASVHTLLVQKRSQDKGEPGRFVKTNLLLCILTYVLVLYSTFLTRSGILGDSSVHSFVSPGNTVYILLILFVLSFTLLGFGAIAYRWKYLNEKFNFEESLLSKELALFTGSVTLIASAIIILVGTSAPIFGTTVEIRFYNEMNLPIGIIIGLLNGLSLLLKWKTTKKENFFKESRNSIIATVLASALVIVTGNVTDIMLIIFTFATAFSLIVNLEIMIKIISKNLSKLGAYVAHIGIALFFLGVIATGGFTQDKQVKLEKGETVSVFGYDLTFTGYTPFENNTKYRFNINVAKDGIENTISPVMYIAEFNNSLMREPDILNKLTKDFYISPLSYSQDGGQGGNSAITMKKGESTNFNGADITFAAFNFPEDAMTNMMENKPFFIGARLLVNYNGETFDVEPRMQSDGSGREFVGVEIPEADIKIDMTNLEAAGSIALVFSKLSGGSAPVQAAEVLSIEASIKPYINLVWLGTVVMVLGFVISVVRRTKESQK